MSEHTAGPWHVVVQPSILGGGRVVVSEHVEDAIVATVGADLPGEEANARLMAAAPDLLEVCRVLMAHWFGDDNKRMLSDFIRDQPDSDIAKVQAAIEKAEGRQ